MDSGRATLVICLSVAIVVGINAAIYVSLSRKNTIGQIELMRRAARRFKNPWEREESDLEELSRRVAELKRREEKDQAEGGAQDQRPG